MSEHLIAQLEAFVRQVFGQRLDFLATYPARVVQQNADGTLELVPDDSRLPTYKQVAIRYGVPGVTATVPAGSRALVSFAGADPRNPIVVGWEAGTVLTIVLAGGSNGVARNGDSITIPASEISGKVKDSLGNPCTATGPLSGTINSGSTKVKAG